MPSSAIIFAMQNLGGADVLAGVHIPYSSLARKSLRGIETNFCNFEKNVGYFSSCRFTHCSAKRNSNQ